MCSATGTMEKAAVARSSIGSPLRPSLSPSIGSAIVISGPITSVYSPRADCGVKASRTAGRSTLARLDRSDRHALRGTGELDDVVDREGRRIDLFAEGQGARGRRRRSTCRRDRARPVASSMEMECTRPPLSKWVVLSRIPRPIRPSLSRRRIVIAEFVRVAVKQARRAGPVFDHHTRGVIRGRVEGLTEHGVHVPTGSVAARSARRRRHAGQAKEFEVVGRVVVENHVAVRQVVSVEDQRVIRSGLRRR